MNEDIHTVAYSVHGNANVIVNVFVTNGDPAAIAA